MQALGGTGGLKIGTDFLQRVDAGAGVWISDPSWENHRALFESAGFKVETYPYYDAARHDVNFAGHGRGIGEASGPVDRRPARVLPQPDRRTT